MKVDRRSFLAFVIGGAAGTALSPLPWKLTDDSSIWTQMWPWTPVPPDGGVSFADTTCTLCPGGCGITVRKVDSRAVKIEGTKGHPVNDGGICMLGLSGLQLLYGPTRIKSPMKRVGKRGEGKWQRISWSEALGILAGKLGEIRNRHEAHTVAALSGADQGTVPALFKRFMTVYGSPNFICMPAFQETEALAVKTLFGASGRTGFDIENADYILSFGSGLVDGWRSPVRMIRAAGKWHPNGITVVQVEPRFSNTAAKATRWVPVAPGTEADLALGIAAILLSQGKASGSVADMLDQRHIMKKYAPEAVARTTGISVETLMDIADGFSRAQRPLALCGRGKAQNPESLRDTAAVYLLNLLVNNINQDGGMWLFREADDISWGLPQTDAMAVAGLRQPRFDGAGSQPYADAQYLAHHLADAITTTNSPYPLQVLLVAGANPCHTLHNAEAVKSAFSQVPFIVSFSSFWDETAQMADLLLPDHMYLERYADVPVTAGLTGQIIGLCKPVVSPQFNTRHLGQTLISLSRRMGKEISEAFPWDSYETCLRKTLSTQWETLMETGVWKSPKVKRIKGNLKSGNVDFPAALAEGDASAFPLMLIPYDSLSVAAGPVGSPPFMIKAVADTVIKGKDGFVEIHPRTAGELDLKEGSVATLTTPRGEARVRVHLSHGIQPGVIAMVSGLGHMAYDEFLAGKGVNVNALIGPVADPSSGHDVAWGIRARLSNA
ncbi:molybdopterin-dependent oxidoreductase [Desulfosarcina sp. OttesenSCG-928-A07]|nr:molybdopterin-dependent oxidoreductase [Desulfosarcina sp. OttesenSCG-928-G17]MDL2328441.1 molybdopterin-dependent oxidoreductase [Desulfosarcina sp. OttesenSCG-928-A07]